MSQPDAQAAIGSARTAAAQRAQWRWEFRDRGGAVLDKPMSPVFTSRFDAEAWLGEHWRGLATDRVVQAQLFAGADAVGTAVELREASDGTPGSENG